MRKLLRMSAHPALVVPFWLALGAALVATSGAPWAALIGAGLWGPVEYVAHRWAMHGLAKRWPKAYRKVHGVHHGFPLDVSHFSIPLPAAAVVASALGAVAVLLLGQAVGLASLGGLLLAYACYDLIHLGCHGLGPSWLRWIARPLVAHHQRHHDEQAKCFAVTAPWLDVAMGTR